MILEPINDNIVVRIEKPEKEQKTKSGILIATSNKNPIKSDRGIVTAVGQGRMTMDGKIIPLNVEVGDKIIFNRFAGTEVSIEDRLYLIIKENDILVKIK